MQNCTNSQISYNINGKIVKQIFFDSTEKSRT